MPHNFEITEDDIFRIARTGAQNPHDEEIVRTVFEELSQPAGTVGALSEKAIPYTMTVAQLFDAVKHAPMYLESSILVGAAITHLYEADMYDYRMSGEHTDRQWVSIVATPVLTSESLQIPLTNQELYDGGVTFTTSKAHAEGYADPLQSLYGFSCVASREDSRPTGQRGASLRDMIRSLQAVVASAPDLPVVLRMVGGEEDWPVIGVCWIKEDDSVILRYSTRQK